MTRNSHILVPAILALSVAGGLAFAQTAPAPQAADPAQRHRPSADAMQRMEDGRFAMIKGALKLTDAQQKLWQPVEDHVRARHAAQMKAMQERDAMRDDVKPDAKRDEKTAQASLADRLDRQSKRAAAEADQLKSLTAVFRPFFDSLSEEQKVVAGPLMAGLTGDHRMHGHRFAGHNDHGDRGERRGGGQQ